MSATALEQIRLVLALALAAWAGPASAAMLSVSPTLVRVDSPSAAGALTLRNDGDGPAAVQVRVFEWTKQDGQDRLRPTDKVVASPPMATLSPNKDYLVRIVRTDKTPVRAVENYRLFVDQLPDPSPGVNNVKLLVRQSIPVFFRAGNFARASVVWTLRKVSGKVVLSAVNNGDDELRLTSLTLVGRNGKTVSLGKGLIGYILGRATTTWDLPKTAGALANTSVQLSADTQEGALRSDVGWVSK